MRFIKAGIFFAVSFAIAWILIFTFIQAPFHHPVPAKLLWRQTPPYPIFYYLIGAFVIGLAIGIGISVYYYVVLSVQVHKKAREARKAEKRARALEEQLEDCVHADQEQPEALPAPVDAPEPTPEVPPRSPSRDVEEEDEAEAFFEVADEPESASDPDDTNDEEMRSDS